MRRPPPRSRWACCRSRARSSARSPRLTTCSIRRRSRSSREASLPIRHCLVGVAGAALEDGATLRSHPAALRPVPRPARRAGRPLHPCGDDRRRGARGGRGGRPRAARDREPRGGGGSTALEVVADDVGDRPAAFTRFVALAPYTQVAGARGLAHRALVRHRPPPRRAVPGPRRRSHGYNVNLVQLVSRPLPELAVALPVRRGARRARVRSERCGRRSPTCAARRASCGCSAPTRRRISGERADVVREDLGRARRRAATPASRRCSTSTCTSCTR